MKIQKRKQMLIITAVSLACVLTTGYILDLSSARQTKAEILTAEEQAALETDLSDPSEAETENVTEMENVAEAEDPAEADGEIPDSYTIGGFPIIYQMPELPTGCEITAAAMALRYYGFSVDKTELADQYLPTLYSAGIYYDENGLPHGNDMNQYFIGDPRTQDGIICGTGAIVTALDTYLSTVGSSLRATDLTGATPEELYELVSEGTPVIVWCTIGMADRGMTRGWYTETGEYVDWATNDHGAILIGYTPQTVIIADPISGQVEYDREQFESVFASRSGQCVILSAEEN